MTVTGTTEAGLIAAARALAPAIGEAQAETEQAGRLPAPLLAAMTEAGLFRLYLPRVLDGPELDPIAFTRVIEAVARVDGATGWNLTVGAVYSALAGFLREDVARMIWADPGTVIAGTINPTGRAVAVPGGYRVSGRWGYGSGILHSTWVLGNCVVIEGEEPRRQPDGSPEMRVVLMPRAACIVHDTWHVNGLRGTGSHDYEIADCFVPEERTLVAFTAAPTQPGTLYACPFITIFAASIAAPALGIARGAIDALVALAQAKTPTGARSLLRDRTAVQVAVAQAEALVGSGRAFLFETLGALWATMGAGEPVTLAQRAMVRIACAHAAISAARAVDLMYEAGGATANYTTSPLERAFRDVHAATQHIAVVPHNYELGGRVLLGLDPGTPRF